MSRIEGHADQGLLQEKGGRGFPYLVFMDAEGTVIQKVGGWREVEGFQQTGWAIDAQNSENPADAAMAKLVLGSGSLADTRTALEGIELTEAQQARWAKLEPHFEMAELAGQVRSKALSPGDAGAKLAGWLGTPKEPTSGTDRMMFWQFLMAHAEASKDVALFEKSMGVLKEAFTKAYGNHPQLPKLFQQWADKLAQIKGGAGE